MKYATEVIDFMKEFPGRQFRMNEIVRHVDPAATGLVRQRTRNGVLRVLESLDEHGLIDVEKATQRGGFATYAWKVPHQLSQKCHAKCHNTAGPLCP